MTTTCPKCGDTHDPTRCQGHVVKDPETREPIPPRQCAKTPVKGSTVCRSHGAAKGTPAAAAAVRRQREAEASALVSSLLWNPSAEPVKDPFGELQLLAGQMRQAVDLLGAMLGPGDPCDVCGMAPVALDSPAGVAWLKQQRELRGVLEAMGRLGIASRAVEVQQGQADLMLSWLRSGLEAGIGEGMTRGQVDVVVSGFLEAMRRSRAGSVVAGELGSAS